MSNLWGFPGGYTVVSFVTLTGINGFKQACYPSTLMAVFVIIGMNGQWASINSDVPESVCDFNYEIVSPCSPCAGCAHALKLKPFVIAGKD